MVIAPMTVPRDSDPVATSYPPSASIPASVSSGSAMISAQSEASTSTLVSSVRRSSRACARKAWVARGPWPKDFSTRMPESGFPDGGRQVSHLVLRPPSGRPVAPLVAPAQHHQRYRHDHGEHPERRCDHQQDNHPDQHGQHVDHQEQAREGDEPADRAQVTDRSGQQLPGLPAVMECHRKLLQVVVEIGAHPFLDLRGRARPSTLGVDRSARPRLARVRAPRRDSSSSEDRSR